MRLTILAATSAALALACAGLAQASTLVDNFTFTGVNASANGQLFIDSATDVNGFHVILGITGTNTLNGNTAAFTGLSGYAGADNLLSDSAPFVDFAGFSADSLNGPINIFWDGAGHAVLAFAENPGGVPDNLHNGVLNVSSAPEPASWALMILGFGGIGGAIRSRQRKMAINAIAA